MHPAFRVPGSVVGVPWPGQGLSLGKLERPREEISWNQGGKTEAASGILMLLFGLSESFPGQGITFIPAPKVWHGASPTLNSDSVRRLPPRIMSLTMTQTALDRRAQLDSPVPCPVTRA